MKASPSGPVGLPGEVWAHGAMAALVHAELLAAQAGVVPWLTLPDGSRGVVTVGAARERIARAPEDVRTIYLATHAIVRATHASAAPLTGDVRELANVAGEDELGEPITLVVALTVVAIAAIIGTAWYFTRRSEIQVEGRNLRTTALAAEVARLAHEQLARGETIDAGSWDVLREIAKTEAVDTPWLALAVGGLALVGGVGGIAYWKLGEGGPMRAYAR